MVVIEQQQDLQLLMQSVCQWLDDHVQITCHFVLGILYTEPSTITITQSKTKTAQGGHISRMIGTTYGNGLHDPPYIILTEKQFTVPPSFRGVFFLNFSQSAKLAMTPLLFCPIAMKSYNGSSIDTFCKSESGFAGEDSQKSTKQKQKLSTAVMFVN